MAISTCPLNNDKASRAFRGGCSVPADDALKQGESHSGITALGTSILKTLYGTDEPKWVSFREQLETVPGLAEAAIRKIGINAGIAPDVIGNAQPVFLISKDDWDHQSFNTLVDEVLAFQPKDEKETVNV